MAVVTNIGYVATFLRLAPNLHLPRDPVGNRLLAWKTLPWVESKASHPLSDAPMKCARIMDQDCIINNISSTNSIQQYQNSFALPWHTTPCPFSSSKNIVLAAHSMDKVCLVTTPPWSPAVRGASPSPRYLGGSLHPRNTLLSTQTSRPQEYNNYSQTLFCARLVDLAVLDRQRYNSATLTV